MKKMGIKLAIFLGIIIIAGTASLMILPFSETSSEKKEGPQNPIEASFQNMRSAEDNMMDFINQEKTEIAAQMQQFSFP